MDELLTPVYEFLIQTARKQTVTYYGDVAEHIGLVGNNRGHLSRVFKMLDQINELEAAASRPLLSVIVISKSRNLPGPGFFSSPSNFAASTAIRQKKRLILPTGAQTDARILAKPLTANLSDHPVPGTALTQHSVLCNQHSLSKGVATSWHK